MTKTLNHQIEKILKEDGDRPVLVAQRIEQAVKEMIERAKPKAWYYDPGDPIRHWKTGVIEYHSNLLNEINGEDKI